MDGAAGLDGAGPQGSPGVAPFALNGLDAVYTQGGVGVGTTTPEGTLELANASATLASPQLAIEGSGGLADDFSIYAPFGDNTLRFGFQGSVDEDVLLLDGSEGRVEVRGPGST